MECHTALFFAHKFGRDVFILWEEPRGSLTYTFQKFVIDYDYATVRKICIMQFQFDKKTDNNFVQKQFSFESIWVTPIKYIRESITTI